VRNATPEITKSSSNGSNLAETWGGMAPGVTDLPVDQFEKMIHLNDEQLKALDALKAASSQAGDILKASRRPDL
jgi:hypothetical protein